MYSMVSFSAAHHLKELKRAQKDSNNPRVEVRVWFMVRLKVMVKIKIRVEFSLG